jgi:hypothetical protein
MPEDLKNYPLSKAELLAKIKEWQDAASHFADNWMEEEACEGLEIDDPEEAYWYWTGYLTACKKIKDLAQKLPD